MKIKDIVVLNKEGLSCYMRNKHYKKIKPGKKMKIIATHGFDNGKNIYEVEHDGLTDYYFENCLEVCK